MANALYPLFKQSLLTQSPSINFSSDTIKVMLCRSYSYNPAHQYQQDVIANGTVVSTATIGSNKTYALGVFDADDVTFTSVSAGAACTSLIIFKDTTVSTTSPLIAFIDTASGLPVTPVGVNIAVTWDSSSSRIFAL